MTHDSIPSGKLRGQKRELGLSGNFRWWDFGEKLLSQTHFSTHIDHYFFGLSSFANLKIAPNSAGIVLRMESQRFYRNEQCNNRVWKGEIISNDLGGGCAQTCARVQVIPRWQTDLKDADSEDVVRQEAWRSQSTLVVKRELIFYFCLVSSSSYFWLVLQCKYQSRIISHVW